jgi:hypothetical protein
VQTAELVLEGLARAERLGWRTISLRRLRQLAAGNEKALPPEPPPVSTTHHA